MIDAIRTRRGDEGLSIYRPPNGLVSRSPSHRHIQVTPSFNSVLNLKAVVKVDTEERLPSGGVNLVRAVQLPFEPEEVLCN